MTEALAVYGTLMPGESNHHVVAMIRGRWHSGTVRGHLGQKTSGTYHGYPALRLDRTGPTVPVAVLVSEELTAHWERLDDFEGPEYRRVEVEVALATTPHGPPSGVVLAQIYEVLTQSEIEGLR